MARIAGTKAERTRKRSLPSIPVDPFIAALVLSPVAILAPTDWVRAICVVAVIAVAWVVGFHDGRADHAREVLRDLGRDDRAA